MAEESTGIVVFESAGISNGENIVVDALDMTVKQGEMVYITGRVGSGKSSIIHTMTAENALAYGRGRVCGFDLGTITPSQIPQLRRKMGVVFQDFKLLMDRSVEKNLEFVLRATGWTESFRIDDRINSALSAVGMETKAHKMPHQLSGGEQQRVCIARAILNSPQLILADEPTGNLDVQTTAQIMDLLTGINADKGTAIIMVTHRDELLKTYPGRQFVCCDEQCREV